MLTTNNKDYRGLMVNSMTKYFYELSKINEDYHKMAAELYWLLTDSYAKYKSFCRDAGEGVHMLSALDNMTVYVDESPIDRSEFAYYEDLAKVPADVQKNFFGCGVELTMTHIKKLSSLLSNLTIDTREVCSYIKEFVSWLYNDGSQNLLTALVKLSLFYCLRNWNIHLELPYSFTSFSVTFQFRRTMITMLFVTEALPWLSP